MTGGEAVYHALLNAGVKYVFGIVSVHNLPIYDAISRSNKIKSINIRHEQAAVHAADSYARTTGKLGVAITSTGPGAANGVPGLYEAAFASSPVLMITGQIDTQYLGKGKGFLHEAENQAEMLRTITCCVETVHYRKHIISTLYKVIEAIFTGRPQPGCIEIPINLQFAEFEEKPRNFSMPQPIKPEQKQINMAKNLLGKSIRPMIISGGGVVHSNTNIKTARPVTNLQLLAEKLQAPVLMSTNGRGSLSDDHPLALGAISYHQEIKTLIEEADVILAVGTRLQVGPNARNLTNIKGKLIHADIDDGVISRVHPAEITILGDAHLTLSELNNALETQTSADLITHRNQWIQKVMTGRDVVKKRLRNQIGSDHAAIMDIIRNLSSPSTIIARDSTVPTYLWGNQLLSIIEPKTSLHPTSGAIGPGLPFAIGASISINQHTVLIQGDGGFMLHLGELATVKQYGLPIIICLFNDSGYGILRRIQATHYSGRTFDVDLETPQFSQIAQGMGINYYPVKNIKNFNDAFTDALKTKDPSLIDINLNALQPIKNYPPTSSIIKKHK